MTDSNASKPKKRPAARSWRRLLPWVPAAVVFVVFLARAWTMLRESSDDVAGTIATTAQSTGSSATGSGASGSTGSAAEAGQKPTEIMRPVIESVAPLLTGMGKRRRVAAVLHAGELLMFVGQLPASSWLGPLAGQRAERQGLLLRMRRAAGEAPYLVYASDLGPAVEVPSAHRICDLLAKQPTMLPAGRKTCVERLRRARLVDGRLLVFTPCMGRCPVALLRGDDLSAIQVDGVVDGQLLEVEKKPVLALTARSNRANGKLTAGRLALIAFGGEAPVRGGTIELDRIDARHDTKVASRVGTVEFRGSTVRFVGEEKVMVRDSAKVLSHKPFDEHYRIGPDASATKQ